MDLTAPGVFCQGLHAFDEANNRIHDEFLDPAAIAAVEAVCAGDDRLTLCAYCREMLVTPATLKSKAGTSGGAGGRLRPRGPRLVGSFIFVWWAPPLGKRRLPRV